MEKVFTILHYCDGDDETYCNVFATRQDAVDYVKDCIRQDYQSDDYDDRTPMEETMREAEKSLAEKGVWHDGCDTYVFDEKEVIGSDGKDRHKDDALLDLRNKVCSMCRTVALSVDRISQNANDNDDGGWYENYHVIRTLMEYTVRIAEANESIRMEQRRHE